MPAVTLPALAAAAAIVAIADRSGATAARGRPARERIQPQRLAGRPPRERRVDPERGLPEPEPRLVVLGLALDDVLEHAHRLPIAVGDHQELRLADLGRRVGIEAPRVLEQVAPALDLGRGDLRSCSSGRSPSACRRDERSPATSHTHATTATTTSAARATTYGAPKRLGAQPGRRACGRRRGTRGQVSTRSRVPR